jgi:RNA polymerase sigma-54 factor
MALEQRLNLKLAQKLVMTPTLQQAIKLLQLSRLELEQALSQELQVNPLLELSEEAPSVEEAAEPGRETEPTGAAGEEGESRTDEPADPFKEVNVEELFSNFLHDSPSTVSTWQEEEGAPFENSPAPQATMFDALCEQLHLLAAGDGLVALAEFVVGNLDPDGYLRIGEDELAAQCGANRAALQEAIALVQRLDPPGIGARSLQECFLLQLHRYPREVDPELLALTRRIVAEAFDDLLHQRWERITRRFSVDLAAVRGVIELLRHLSPRPGVELGPADNSVVEPDVIVEKVDEEWRVSLNDDGLPRLRLSPRYLRMLRAHAVDGEAAGYLRERMRAALWFLRSVEQRQSTIAKVAQAIVRRQEEFLDSGLQHLRPLVLRDIADDIGMHESTVSRVVSNKYIATPRGVFPLKFFFHSSISHAVEGDISSVVVKDHIKDLIAAEEPSRPLSDARVARQLNRMGIRIARRTVAKYREEMGIPSSEQRRRALR